MEVFFNELSVRPATSDAEARQWIEILAELGQSLKNSVESLSDNAFTFRRSEDFGQLPLTTTQTILGFLQDQYDFGDAVYVFLLGVFDSPYITENDPQRTDFDYTSLTFAGKEHPATGLSAAYLKNGLAVSFDSSAVWDTCQFDAQINRLDIDAVERPSWETIDHASRKQHLIDCHLGRLADLFDWKTHRYRFDCDAKKQTLLPLISLYSLHVDSWKFFYREVSQLNEGERVARILIMAERIATVQRWQPATGNLNTRNADRTVYIIPNSNFLIGVDTQHCEFEIHHNQPGNNHAGAITFDGLRFKPAIANRRLLL